MNKVINGVRNNKRYLGPLTQGDALRVCFVCTNDVAETALGKEIIDCFRAKADGPTPSQALAEP